MLDHRVFQDPMAQLVRLVLWVKRVMLDRRVFQDPMAQLVRLVLRVKG